MEIFGSLNRDQILVQSNNKNTMSTSIETAPVSLQRGELAEIVVSH